jgi:drug/metabolite transporter (DMT)-like permease
MRSEHKPNKKASAAYAALAFSIALNAAALILIRALVGALSPGLGSIGIALFIRAISSWLFWAGALSFLAGLYFWVQSLKVIPLSLAYPSSATSYIVIAPLSWWLFGEPITATRVLGMAIIIVGVALLYRRRKPGVE